MRSNSSWVVISLLLMGLSAHADTSSTPAAPTAPPPPTSPTDPATKTLVGDSEKSAPENAPTLNLSDWNREDWTLLKPQVNILELNGYFRFRAGLFRKLDFDNNSKWDSAHHYPANSGDSSDKASADYSTTNIRLRIEPIINISDDIRIVTTFDVFDNLVLGSTPNSPVNYTSHHVPVELLNSSQSATDMIAVKRAYASITALNQQLELNFGRQPDAWGLGMMLNSGDCLDCNHGNTVDRLSVTFRMLEHFFTPAYTWRSNGPIFHPFGINSSQALDAYTWDDVDDFSLRIYKRDHPEDIRDQVSQGDVVLNYGLLNAYRMQARGLDQSFYHSDNTKRSTAEQDIDILKDLADVEASGTNRDELRDAWLYTGDAFLEFYVGDFKLALEAALKYGTFKDTVVNSEDDSAEPQETSIFQTGAALEMTYSLSNGNDNGTLISLKAGGASGDSAPGFGSLGSSGSQRYKSNPPLQGDANLNNFQFNPDYHIDLLLFRQIIGTVTDAWYIRPSVTYSFNERLTGSLAGIYSQAFLEKSTASCFDSEPGSTTYECEGNDKKGEKPLGIEIDAELEYNPQKNRTGGGVGGVIAGGVLFPLTGFNNLTKTGDDRSGSFAWTLQARLHVTF